MRRYFCGEEAAAAKEEEAAEAGADNGAHRLRFGDAGLSSGSKSRVLFKVAPQAMARSGQGGSERGAAVEAAAAGPTQRRLPRCLEWAGGEGRERRGRLRQGRLHRLPAGLSLGSGPGSGSSSPGSLRLDLRSPCPLHPARPGQIPPAAGGGARAVPRGAVPVPGARCGAADAGRWRWHGPGGGDGGGDGAPGRNPRTSNMASTTTPPVQTPAPPRRRGSRDSWFPRPVPRRSKAGRPLGSWHYSSRRALRGRVGFRVLV